MTKIVNIVANAIRSEEKYQANRRADWKFIKECARKIDWKAFPVGTNIYLNPNNITIRIPWGLDNLRQTRIAIGSDWEFSNNYTESSGTLSKTYNQYGPEMKDRGRIYVSLSIIMDSSDLDEDSCKRIEVGEKTFTEKQYMVICADHVTEMRGKAEEIK